MDKTELEKAAKEYVVKSYNVNASFYDQVKEAFESGAKWRDSLPSPSVEEIRERFVKRYSNKLKHVDDLDYFNHIFNFFLPYIKGYKNTTIPGNE